LDLVPFPEKAWDWFGVPASLRNADVVILQRKLIRRWQLALLRSAARYLVYDLDDALFLRDSYAVKGFESTSRLGRFRAMVRAADLVVAGNDFLAEHAARWAPSERVAVIPTCVDPFSYPISEHARPAGQARLVWIGSASTLRGLERCRPLLEHLGRSIPGLQLKLICDRFLRLDHLPVLLCPWTPASETVELAAGDIGMSWVPDDDWSRGKCGLKILQYMAAGLPVVANSVGVQTELVRHGATGYLAETAGEWADAVARLARDPELRRRLGKAGRQRVEAEYCVTVGAGRWLDLLVGPARGRQTA
jgi:glycosyltransferase involved in cell wall biosynthesis